MGSEMCIRDRAVTEDLILPKPGDVKDLMNKMDKLLKLIESK